FASRLIVPGALEFTAAFALRTVQEMRGHVPAVQSRGPPFKEGPGALCWLPPHILQPSAAGTERSADSLVRASLIGSQERAGKAVRAPILNPRRPGRNMTVPPSGGWKAART